jgi:hypothetical protein
MNADCTMKPIHLISKMLVTISVMSIVTLAPIAVPIVTPYPAMRIRLICQAQTVGSLLVIDAQGHLLGQLCDPVMPVVTAYPMLFPADSAAWYVVMTASSIGSHTGHPGSCYFSVTHVPVHLQCASRNHGPYVVDLDISPLDVEA